MWDMHMMLASMMRCARAQLTDWLGSRVLVHLVCSGAWAVEARGRALFGLGSAHGSPEVDHDRTAVLNRREVRGIAAICPTGAGHGRGRAARAEEARRTRCGKRDRSQGLSSNTRLAMVASEFERCSRTFARGRPLHVLIRSRATLCA